MTPDLRELHEMVTQVKCDKEEGLAYMKAYETGHEGSPTFQLNENVLQS